MWWPALTQRSYNCVPLLHSPGPPVLSATAPWPRSSGFSLSAFVPWSTSWFWSCSPSRAWSSTPHYASALPPSWTWWGLGFVWASGAALRGHMSCLVLEYVSCSCFHFFYFVIWFMLLVSCFPCPHAFLPCVCVMLWFGCFCHVSCSSLVIVVSCGSQFYLLIGWILSRDP